MNVETTSPILFGAFAKIRDHSRGDGAVDRGADAGRVVDLRDMHRLPRTSAMTVSRNGLLFASPLVSTIRSTGMPPHRNRSMIERAPKQMLSMSAR